MDENKYERNHKEDKPVLAICYDFDKTLSPDDMQAQGYIQSVGYDKTDDFWHKSNDLATNNDMDQNLAYMYQMMQEARGKLVFTKEKLEEYGASVTLFPGVKEWFSRIMEYGELKGVIVEHYIISSGLKEMIEGTSVAKENSFKKIYASSFYYDDKGVAVWPAQVVNYTNKTQFLFRIEKGVLDINDPGVNDYFKPEEIRVPFRNMVYIGDSDTDIPCMKLVNLNGGHSIGVYNQNSKDKSKVFKMMRENRIKYFVPSDYTEESELDSLIKAIIDKTVANEILEDRHFHCEKENLENDEKNGEEQKHKMDLLIKLENSGNFARTHEIIGEMNLIKKWNDSDYEKLFDITLINSQVYTILSDNDIKAFYERILSCVKKLNENAKSIKNIIK